MMDTIEARVGAWLDGKKPPRGLNETQAASLRGDILGVVRKHASGHGVDAWIGELLERMILACRQGIWPDPVIWAQAVGATNKPKDDPKSSEVSATERSFRIFVSRVQNGEAVGEPELFGRFADRALRDGLFSLQELRQRQRAAFNARRRTYGDAAALRWLDERQPQLGAELKAQREASDRLPYADDGFEA